MKLRESCWCGATLEVEYGVVETLTGLAAIESFHRAHRHRHDEPPPPIQVRPMVRQLAIARRRG